MASLVKLASTVEDSIQDAVIGRRNHGYSWTETGIRLGISRQAARQKWASHGL